ncbi:putative amidase PB8B6.03 [Cyphellophora attinorum]|uniref:amidase n=1 Tax=Cyphellophora attinorum TaxID=1664694 RepID=A0A0N1HRS3_9EURO|nr:putative amidase PB8B6.03 [Phialophora attinorum]KPI41085.1 putative amidase PB8B6.03 [Phialophora attinorum]
MAATIVHQSAVPDGPVKTGASHAVVEVPPWKIAAGKKRDTQWQQIPEEWRLSPLPSPLPRSTLAYLEATSLLDDKEKSITSTLSADHLLTQIHSGVLSSLEVTAAFCKRAAIAQQLSRCCTEMMFDRAMKRAKELDRHLHVNGKVVGPLHGLPVSIKDVFDVEGFDTSIGWVGRCGKPATTNSTLVDILQQQGAIIYCKTNVSQSLMMSDSYNHVFKQSVNTLNRDLISGGSSGGEGALVGCHGSLVGIGTDIGGSIRIPANLQGLYGLSPSTGRVPFDKSVPIASSLSTIETFMKGVAAGQPWRQDVTTYPISWRQELAQKSSRPLRIGYYVDDGNVKVQPPVERAMRETVEKLQAAGHEMIPWDVNSHVEAHRLWTKAILFDGGRDVSKMLEESGEPLVQGMLVGKAADCLSIQEAEEYIPSIARPPPNGYPNAYLHRWNANSIDALIMPVLPWVGFRPKTWVKSSQCVSYTGHWNFVDFAALTIPVTVARLDDVGDDAWKNHVPRNESDRFNWHQYDPKLVEGMPVCVQVVGGRFGEEICVGVGKAVEAALGR